MSDRLQSWTTTVRQLVYIFQLYGYSLLLLLNSSSKGHCHLQSMSSIEGCNLLFPSISSSASAYSTGNTRRTPPRCIQRECSTRW